MQVMFSGYPNIAKSDSLNAVTVFPDIIVHRRGPDGPNLLIIEAKKSNTDDEKDRTDIHKLEAYVAAFDYSFAYYIVFQVAQHYSSDIQCMVDKSLYKIDTGYMSI